MRVVVVNYHGRCSNYGVCTCSNYGVAVVTAGGCCNFGDSCSNCNVDIVTTG